MLRIFLFLATNLAIMVAFSIILSLLGIESQSVTGLAILAGLFGFGGSLISLRMSKWMAKRSVGAHIIQHPSNPTEAWLVNIVTQYANKAHIKVPEIAIYPSDDVNAFATGPSKNNSLVAVSSGLLNAMSREEAEAVIGHEIAHVANGDMVTMSLIQGVVNTFVIFISRILAQLAAGFLGNSDEEEGEGGSYLVYYICSFVFEILFGFLASFITMWFSRRREYKADQGGAYLAGKANMIGALQRLKSASEPSLDDSMLAFGIHGKSKSLGELLMSHPKLDDRIAALQNS